MLASGLRFEIIISDLNMPFMSGSEVHDAVTFWSSPLLPHFIVMSADPNVAAEMESKRTTSYRFHALVKPFRTEQLRALVARLLVKAA